MLIMYSQNRIQGSNMISCDSMGKEDFRDFKVRIKKHRSDPQVLKILKVGIHLGKEQEMGEIFITKQQLAEVQTVKNTSKLHFTSFTMTSVAENSRKTRIIGLKKNFGKISLKILIREMEISNSRQSMICLTRETPISLNTEDL